MKHYTNEELKHILGQINDDVVYCGICNGRGVGRIFLSPYNNIAWQHYGSSANKNSIKELRWVLETIFEDCECVTPAEWSDYHINYIPIDKQYQGIDHSTSHPNVCGL